MKKVLRLLMIALLLLPIIGPWLGQGFEASASSRKKSSKFSPRSEKLAADLKDMSNRSPNRMVSVILQTPSGPSATLLTQIAALGGKVRRKYRHINAISIKLPARSAALLSGRFDVEHVSIERTT